MNVDDLYFNLNFFFRKINIEVDSTTKEAIFLKNDKNPDENNKNKITI